MDLTARLPGRLAPALLDATSATAPGGNTPVQLVDVFPKTLDQRVHLFPDDLPSRGGLYTYEDDPATAEFPLSLISPASEHTISSTLGEFRPGVTRVRIHPDDAHPRSIGEADSVRIFNALGDVHCEATVTPEVRPGTLSLPKGLWARSTFNGSTSNALVPDSLTDLGGGACFNDARVQVAIAGH